jgi:hypothetical protein
MGKQEIHEHEASGGYWTNGEFNSWLTEFLQGCKLICAKYLTVPAGSRTENKQGIALRGKDRKLTGLREMKTPDAALSKR